MSDVSNADRAAWAKRQIELHLGHPIDAETHPDDILDAVRDTITNLQHFMRLTMQLDDPAREPSDDPLGMHNTEMTEDSDE